MPALKNREPVPKLIDCALTRTVLGQALAVFQAFSLAKLRISRKLSQNFSFGKASRITFLFVVALCVSSCKSAPACKLEPENTIQDKFPLVISSYDLNLSFNFDEGSLAGICRIEIENTSDSDISEIPFLLYRLMHITEATDISGGKLSFAERIVQFDDFPVLQVNYIVVQDRIRPHESKTVILRYEGYLLGYAETGMLYIKDKISPRFTMIRQDSFAYPYLAKPNFLFLRQNIADFNYTITATVPDGLIVASGGQLLSKTNSDNQVTYTYKSKVPSWRIDVAIAPYRIMQSDIFDIFYYSEPSAAESLANYGAIAFDMYEKWWGELQNKKTIAIIETEEGSGGQADKTAILLPEEAGKRITFLKDSFASDQNLLNTPMVEYGNKDLTYYSYIQGMVMFTVLYYWLGQEEFNGVIGGFYREYHDREAVTNDFTSYWIRNSAVPEKVQAFFDDWVYTTNYTAFIPENMTIDDMVKQYHTP
ncbi:MAG: hypothetical protein LBP71_04195 [Spirochaetaceae bacterium]|jgi:hypothetical protein|nr:hypothetical protein [Spirochaetaceae bacterium]